MSSLVQLVGALRRVASGKPTVSSNSQGTFLRERFRYRQEHLECNRGQLRDSDRSSYNTFTDVFRASCSCSGLGSGSCLA